MICYHRVQSSSDNRFQGYKPTISASEETFTRQMDYLRANYDPITLRDLVAWLDPRTSSPAATGPGDLR